MEPDEITQEETALTTTQRPPTPQAQALANLTQLAHLCVDMLAAQAQGG